MKGSETYMVASKYARLNVVVLLGTLLNAICELVSGLTCDEGIRGGRP